VSGNPARSRAVPILLWLSPAWGLLLIAASIWLPVYTLNTNTVGVQPRVSIWTEFGLAGLTPAVIAIVIAITEVSLLLPDRGVVRNARVIAARTLGLAVAAAAFVGLAFLHLEGLLFVVFASLLVAASRAAPMASARPQRLAASFVP
jgi:NO-binding membrane sensor protein with MHYT domain